MKIAVLGAGAMGSLYGGYLSAGNEVVLVDIWKDHVDAINSAGLKIEENGGESIFRPQAVTEASQAGKAELVIVFVKSTQTYSALKSAKDLIGPDTILLSLQNGYGNADDMLEFAPREQVLVGTTGHGCTMRGPGHIYHAGKGATHIGAVCDDQSKAELVAGLLEKAGFADTHVSSNVLELIWSKLFANIGINAITALLDFTNSNIADNKFARQAAERAVREAIAVANATGMSFDPEAVWENVVSIARKTGANRSSMLADIDHKRRTEIDKINGAVVKKAGQLGMKSPYNEMLTSLIKAKELTY